MKIIEIIVTAQGEVTMQTKGFTGSSCRQASLPFEQALGNTQSDQPTAEMYQAETQAEQNQVRQ